MFNKQLMMEDAQKFLGQKGARMFGQLFDLATSIFNSPNPKAELEKRGINADSIRKAKNILNFPGIGWVVNKYISKEKLLEDLTRIEGLFEPTTMIDNNFSQVEQAPASELEQLQANLAKLK